MCDDSSLQRLFLVTVNQLTQESLDAHAADGILHCLKGIIHNLPLCTIIQLWDSVNAVLAINLSHMASTVRQSCASMFGNIVYRCMMEASDVSHNLISKCVAYLSLNEFKSWQKLEGNMLCMDIMIRLFGKHYLGYMSPALLNEINKANTIIKNRTSDTSVRTILDIQWMDHMEQKQYPGNMQINCLQWLRPVNESFTAFFQSILNCFKTSQFEV